MLLILQMDLKVANRGVWSGRIQFSRAVVTSYSGQVHVFDPFGGLARLRRGARHFGCCVDGGVAHCGLKPVVGVCFIEFDESVCEPGRRSGLWLLATILFKTGSKAQERSGE